MTQEQINYMKEKLIKLKKEDMSGKMTMGEYLTEIILISNIYVQEVNKAILPNKVMLQSQLRLQHYFIWQKQ